MSSKIGTPQQLRQPSRKGKRAWRKNVDLSEIEGGLEDLREEIIHGGPVAEKDADELFALDTTGSELIKQKYKLHKPLKADEILAQRSAVAALDGRKRPHSRIGDGILEATNKRQKKDWVSKKDIQALKQRLDNRLQLSSTRLEKDISSDFDLWTQPEVSSTVTKQDEYIPKRRPKVAPSTLQKPPTTLTVDGRPIQAIPNPDAGISYNPTFEDWDDLLTRVGDKEVAAELVRQEQAALEQEREARIAASAAEELAARTDDESAWEGFESEVEEHINLKQKRPQRKTPAQRNKISRRKQLEMKARHEQRMADKKRQAMEMMSLMVKNNATGADTSIVPATDLELNADGDPVLRRRKLGNTTIFEKQLEIVLPDELQESLRRLKPEGNLLNDRFRHLLVNGKVESRKPVLQHKKKRQTVTEKWSYKDFSIQV